MPAFVKKAWLNMVTGGNAIFGSARVIAPKNTQKTYHGSGAVLTGGATNTNNLWSKTNTLDPDHDDQNAKINKLYSRARGKFGPPR